MDNQKTKILFCGGATGGHLFPALAIFEKFQEIYEQDKMDYLFIGSNYGLESDVLPQKNLNFKSIWIRGIQRGWTWKDLKINFLAPLRIIISLIQSAFYITKFNPDFAIGTGGYSAGPPLYIANKFDIPIFLQEQNKIPGLTTRLLAKHAECTYTAFENSKKFLPRAKTYGIPLRSDLNTHREEEAREFFNLDPDKFTFFLFGGSQGARALNNFLVENIDSINKQYNSQIIWQTGPNDYNRLSEKFADKHRIYLTSFIDRMELAYSAASLVISRAGALTIAELCKMGIPSILVPLPTAAENHQEQNARELEEEGAARVLLEDQLNLNSFQKILSEIFDEKKLSKMEKAAKNMSHPEAADKIVNDIISIMDQK